jgi:hypothetical protein
MRASRVRLVLGAAVVTAIAAGVGSAGDTQSAGRQPSTPSVPVEPVEVPRAFLRPASNADRVAAMTPAVREVVDVLTTADPGVATADRTGASRGDVRVLLAGLGESRRMIFGFRTDRGRICMALSDFTSGCYTNLPANEAVTVTSGDPDRDGEIEPAIVWGFAKSTVRRVSVVVAGEALVLGSNAYFFQAPSPRTRVEELERVLAELHDGSRREVQGASGPRIPSSWGG